MRRFFTALAALLVFAAAGDLLAVETVRGVIRESSEFQCAAGCGTYSLDPDPGYSATMLQGNFRIYVNMHVQVTGFRNNCSGCSVLVPSEPVLLLPPLSVGGEEVNLRPGEVRLRQNYPNPFNPSTVIEYALGAASRVRLSVFNLLGREVALLVDGEQSTGVHRREWSPDVLAGGVYFCQLRISGPAVRQTLTRRMVLLR